MTRETRTLGIALLWIVCVGCISDATVPLAHSPTGESPLSSQAGDRTLVLDVRDGRSGAPGRAIGVRRSEYGAAIARVLAAGEPADALREAVTAELTRAGIRVVAARDAADEPDTPTLGVTLRDLWTDRAQNDVAVVATEVVLRAATGDEVRVDVVGRASGSASWTTDLIHLSNAARTDWSRALVRTPEVRRFLSARPASGPTEHARSGSGE